MTRRKTGIGCALLAIALTAAGCGGGARQEAIKTVRDMDPDARVRLARSYYGGGRISEAMRVLEDGLQEYPDSVALLNYYGQLSLVTGKLEQSEEALKKVLELSPYLSDAHNTLGAVYQEMGRYNEAETEYRTALKDRAYATPEKVYLNLGLLYRVQGRLEEALSMLRKSVEASPGYLQAHYELAGVLEQVGHFREAAREYGVAEPAYRDSGEFHFRFGLVQMKLGNNLEAAEHFRRVIEVSPGSENSAKADEFLQMIP